MNLLDAHQKSEQFVGNHVDALKAAATLIKSPLSILQFEFSAKLSERTVSNVVRGIRFVSCSHAWA